MRNKLIAIYLVFICQCVGLHTCEARKWTAYLEAQYKKGAYTGIKDPNDLAHRLQEDLQAAHHDGHFRLIYAPGMARNLVDTTHMAEWHRVNDSLGLINMRRRNFEFIKVEI